MKRKWYSTSIVKGILTAAAHLCVAVAAVNLVTFICISSVLSSADIAATKAEKYEESENFAEEVDNDSRQILNYLDEMRQFESEGKYDPDKPVDIISYYEKNIITGENESGLAYRLGDLVEWSREWSGDTGYEANGIIVCQRPNGMYSYFYKNDFRQKVSDGDLNLYIGDTPIMKYGALETEFFDELENGKFTLEAFPHSYPIYQGGTETIEQELAAAEAGGRLNIRDDVGNILYADCWSLDKSIEERFAPIGAESLLKAVENSTQLNGKLDDIGVMMRHVVRQMADEVENYEVRKEEWKSGNTNLTYLFADHTAKQLYSNNEEFNNYAKLDSYLSEIKEKQEYQYVKVGTTAAEFESSMTMDSVRSWIEMVEGHQTMTEEFTYIAAVDTSYPVAEKYAQTSVAYAEYAPQHGKSFGAAVSALVLLLVIVIWLTVIAGRRPEDEELHLNAFDRWKTEIAAAAVVVPWGICTVGGLFFGAFSVFFDYSKSIVSGTASTTILEPVGVNSLGMTIVVLYSFVTCAFFLTGYLSLVRRIKAGTFWKNSLLYMLVRAVGRMIEIFWKDRKLTSRTVLTVGGFIALHWILIMLFDRGSLWAFSAMLTVIAADAAALYFAAKNAIARQRIKEGVEKISAGNVDHEIDVTGLKGTDREVAEQINNIGGGLQQAVDVAVKSERLKTDLITNVSHDIKTPLTSIINYVDLLKRENLEDPKVRGYLDILEAKAQRLKTLTEDVVEASKVSSGNISLELMDVNLVEMLNQTIGETSEKMEKRNLEVIADFPEEPVTIHVDGRRMWRVLENIFNNAAKYAMPGTRVYADLRRVDGKMVFSLKNMSEQPLNITADELTERFIRGDVSRSTEGSGLGLSIAKSLTQMQGGTFDLYLDGDLFKVIITFPVVLK